LIADGMGIVEYCPVSVDFDFQSKIKVDMEAKAISIGSKTKHLRQSKTNSKRPKFKPRNINDQIYPLA
jgi:hypothetical protein